MKPRICSPGDARTWVEIAKNANGQSIEHRERRALGDRCEERT
jgi:hypothetical protein